MTAITRIDLAVPYTEKDQAKSHGARWDQAKQTWYAPPGTDLENLERWLPKSPAPRSPGRVLPFPEGTDKGISLAELLGRVKGVINEGFPAAEWVRAEISELRGKNGHLYLTLTERNDGGDILAQAKGIIWRNLAESITAKFEQATGAGLKTDIKILCLARVRFDPLYGLDLIIEDVDPSYTLGDLAAKLARIRANLQQSGLYDRNKRFPAPVDFLRVAVLSPETSAGLGDFRREADRLHLSGLCEFHLFSATFQGVEAPSSIQNAVLQALTAHQRQPFDALVVIRGGGSATDLAWLNDLELAQLLARSPIPLFTGIGHERDDTILDEIAHTRFDTPSKVALHIRTTIKDNALGAAEAWERINVLVERIVHRERTMLNIQQGRLFDGAENLLFAAQRELQQQKAQLERDTDRMLTRAADDLDKSLASIESGAIAITVAAQKDLENLARIVVGLGPQATLQRGFAIVRDDEDKPLTSREAAIRRISFQIEFRDGRLAVKRSAAREEAQQ
jgi:exodeoxyribonuclease VII large subunit